MKWSKALTVAAGLAMPLVAGAGEIGVKVTVNGQSVTTFRPVSAGQPITIDLEAILGPGPLSGTTDVHVFDVVANDMEDSVGMITLRGDNSNNQTVRFVIASAALTDVETAFTNPATPGFSGLKDLGGLEVLSSHGSSTNLRDRTAVNISVSGDIIGPVTAGRLFRVQAFRLQGASTGGTISGNLRATSPDGTTMFPALDFLAIGQIWAGWQITGDIIADGGAFDFDDPHTWGSVDRIVVNPPALTAPTPAIGGDILCPKGIIGDIVCSGVIGRGPNGTEPVTISAGLRLGRITIREEGSSAVGSKAIHAHVDASATNIPFSGRQTDSNSLSGLSVIETNGDLSGRFMYLTFMAQETKVARLGVQDQAEKKAFSSGDTAGPTLRSITTGNTVT